MKKILIKTILTIIVIVTLSIGLLTGCGKNGSKGITVYTALEPEQVERYLALWKEKHPDIPVNIVRESTGVITARLLAEGVNTTADLVWGTAVTSLLVLDELNLLEPYTPAGLNRIHRQFRDDVNPPKWVGLNAWELAIVVNTRLAEQMRLPEIKSYQDLIRPEFKGQIVMSNPTSSGTGFLAISGLIQAWGEQDAFKYLDQLHVNIAQYIHSGSRPARMAGAGEFAVGISFGYAGVNVLNAGNPVKIVFPVEGSGWDVEANALVKHKNINPNAKLFLDWAISNEVMTLMAKDYAIISTGSNVIPKGYSRNPMDQLLPNDFKWAAKNRDRILAEWQRRYE